MREVIPTELWLRLMNATPEQYAAVELILGCNTKRRKQRVETGNRKPEGKQENVETLAKRDVIQRVGWLAYRNDFADVWLGEEHFDLSRRAKARACLRYLVEQRAFDAASARDLSQEIDPFVRAQCQLPALPGGGELKIHHYFNPSKSDVARLGRELLRPAGRNGRYFLSVE